MADNEDTPWEPPLAGTEIEHVLGALNRLRTTFRWKADDLDDDALRVRIASSSLTLGGLLKHLALVEDHSSTSRLDGTPIGEPWESTWQSDDWIFSSAAEQSAGDLSRLYDDAVARARARFAAAIADGGLDQPTAREWPDGRHPSLRRLLFDLLEEYGRHVGHADLLRESIDGRVGEDPPGGWAPVSPTA
ncbi:MAG: hypothetical protein QOD30_172 [Actinomycetota bacterium]|nr:hypothetical protein [Actinomycetota bacterium]